MASSRRWVYGPCFRLALRVPTRLWPLLTSRADSSPLPFQAQGKISQDKSTNLRCTTGGSTLPPLDHKSFSVTRPLALRHRLVSGFCSSARRFVTHFLPTLYRPYAVVGPFPSSGLVGGGLAPPSQCPWWAYRTSEERPPVKAAFLFMLKKTVQDILHQPLSSDRCVERLYPSCSLDHQKSFSGLP